MRGLRLGLGLSGGTTAPSPTVVSIARLQEDATPRLLEDGTPRLTEGT